MDAQQLVDTQFDRAVEIVQGLPKSGPVQTGYEEKLAMYSLYKQATVGNVKGPRPALWDMLGRAKWDAWSKRKDLDSYEAKWLYVDELLKVLRKPEYSDKTLAKELIDELEAYDTGGLVAGSPSRAEDEGGSSSSESEDGQRRRLSQSFQAMQQQEIRSQTRPSADPDDADDDESDESDSDDGIDELQARMQQRSTLLAQSQTASTLGRPPSSLSSQRYRTPMASMIVSPPPAPVGSSQGRQRPQTMFTQPQSSQHQHGINAFGLPRHESDPTMSIPISHALVTPTRGLLPDTQPLPNYETPSAFSVSSHPRASSAVSLPQASASVGSSSSTGNFGVTSIPASNSTGIGLVQHPYPANLYPGHPAYRVADSGLRGSHSRSQINLGMQTPPSNMPFASMGILNGSHPALERAVEVIQAHVAALQERMEALETRTLIMARSGPGTPYQSLNRSGQHFGGTPTSSPFTSRMALPSDNGGWKGVHWWDFDEEYFDWENMGLWSVVLAPMARIAKFLLRITDFLVARRAGEAESGSRPTLSPGLTVLRRLLLDVSFVLCLLAIGRKAWRKSGVRRREVLNAFHGVWRAMMGPVVVSKARILVDRGV